MIDKIRIKALKSIKNLTIECSNLNLLVGTNSSGKSTVLQALLLMAQNDGEKMGLNGKLTAIGEFREVRNYYMPNESIKIEIWRDRKKKPAWIEFKENRESDSYVVITSDDRIVREMIQRGNVLYDDYDFEQSKLLSEEFDIHYLSCHRIGVNDIFSKNMLNEFDFGVDGEYSLAYLLKHESDPLDPEIVISDDNITNSLLDQVNYWLNYIVETTLYINDLKKTNYLQVKYNNNPSNASSEALHCRPVNVGSGISYLISILITCLGSEEGSILVIENPEIHLHPKAQSRLCDFLYFISKSGRQLFVETHSDHIFNGVRVGTSTGTMDREQIAVNFFIINKQYETQCNPIIFKEYGKIAGMNEEMGIDDLFDQFEIDLDKMLRL